MDVQALRRAEVEANEWRLSNIRFERRDVVSLPGNRYDIVLAFDCIHDQAHPHRVLAEVRRVLTPGGLFVMSEPRASSNLEDNIDDLDMTFLYVMSLFHCMQVSLAEGGEGLGAAWGEQRARELLEEAGLTIESVMEVQGMLMPLTLFVATSR